MKVFKSKGIIYAEYFLNLLNYRIEDNEIGCSVEGFNNCREQGYIIRIHKDNERYNLESGLTFYVYNNRWSDEPSFTWENKETFETLYSEEAWEERTITCNSVEELVEKAIVIIEEKMGDK